VPNFAIIGFHLVSRIDFVFFYVFSISRHVFCYERDFYFNLEWVWLREKTTMSAREKTRSSHSESQTLLFQSIFPHRYPITPILRNYFRTQNGIFRDPRFDIPWIKAAFSTHTMMPSQTTSFDESNLTLFLSRYWTLTWNTPAYECRLPDHWEILMTHYFLRLSPYLFFCYYFVDHVFG